LAVIRVFDSSALLAVLFNEPGDDVVISHLSKPAGRVSSVNWAEAATKLIDRGASPREVRNEMAQFRLAVVPLDEALALRAAELRDTTRKLGLSLGDRCCLALAEHTAGSLVVTADKAWKSLKPFRVALIR
jgi:ribonuclease VapC